MKVKEDIRSVTYLKSRAAELLEQVNETQRPVVITQNGEARAILQDPESYEEMRSVVGLLKLVAEGEDDLAADRLEDHEAVFSRLRARLTQQHEHGKE